MRDAELSLRIQNDDAAVAVQALFQIIHGFLCRPLGKVSCQYAVGGPFSKHQLHDWFAPACGRGSSAEIIGVASTADQRRIAETSGSFVQRSSGRSCRRNIAAAIKGDRAYGSCEIDGANKSFPSLADSWLAVC